MSRLIGKKIMIISPEAWGPVFVSKHFYARYLAKSNEVYFLNPPGSDVNSKKKGDRFSSEKVEENIHAINYRNPIPRLNSMPKWLQKYFYRRLARSIQHFTGVECFDLVWSFDPYRFFDWKCWLTNFRIYHSVDVHFKKCYEEDIARDSNLVLVSSEVLANGLKKFNPNIHHIGHGADIEGFINGHSVEIELPGANSVKAGLVGNFNNNIDYELIENIATKNPRVDLILIGPYEGSNLGSAFNSVQEKIDKLRRLSNIFFIGPVKSSNIFAWVNKFDINLVLYREDKRDIIINPHKMMAYFYSGKIVVSSWFSEYKNAAKELIYMSERNVEIPQIVYNVAREIGKWNADELLSNRRQFAIENSYANKIQKIEELIGLRARTGDVQIAKDSN